MKSKRKRRSGAVWPFYSTAAVWVICSAVLPMYALSGIITTFAVTCIALALLLRISAKRAPEPEPEAEPEPEPSYGEAVDAVLAENRRAQIEMGRLYSCITDSSVKSKIREIMEISDKIARDAIDDPSDVPQIRKFQSYYLPTTIKLLNAYDRMGAQGIEGENISGTMRSIEEMLDTAAAAYRKQLDSLFVNQAIDIETDIEVMNTLLKRQGLTGSDAVK